LEGAAGKIDVVRIVQAAQQFPEKLSYMLAKLGDIPAVSGIYRVANPDSRMGEIGADPTQGFATQIQRAADFTVIMEQLLAAHSIAGYLWWQWTDNIGEKANFGLVSSMDNAYDGIEARIATSTDAWGYPRGGEQHNYGDTITAIKTGNAGILAALGVGLTPPNPPDLPTLNSATFEGDPPMWIVRIAAVPAVEGNSATKLRFFKDGVFDGEENVALGGPTIHQYTPIASDGTYAFTVTGVDQSGNESGPSPALNQLLDHIAPLAPGMPTFISAVWTL
jgi:hypothetical protein